MNHASRKHGCDNAVDAITTMTLLVVCIVAFPNAALNFFAGIGQSKMCGNVRLSIKP